MTASLQFLLSVATFLGLELGPVDHGRLSVYKPGDGSSGNLLACGGAFTRRQRHIAYRRWWKVGCGRLVLVQAVQTGKWAAATVRDGGPYGVYRGALRRCVQEGRYRLASRAERRSGRLTGGWRWRGAADLSWGLWLALGRPGFLSEVRVYFVPWRRDLRRELLVW